MKRIAAFDFDGTITCKDTLLEFIRFAKGDVSFLAGFLLYSPILVAFKLKLYPNWKAKQKIFTHFFGGMELQEFNTLCERFFLEKGDELIYKDAKTRIKRHLTEGDEVVIISASVENWVRPFATYLGVKQLLGTRLELTDDNLLTGHFASDNCYGAEKVKRLLSLYPERSSYHLTAYGDSRGDKELLAFADVEYYKLFKQ